MPVGPQFLILVGPGVLNGGNKIGRALVPNLIFLRGDAKFRSGLIIYREKPKSHESLDQVLRSHSCKIRQGPGKVACGLFRPSLDVPWQFQAKGKIITYVVLIRCLF